ncbi:MAG: hypothetical protein WCJ30_23945, partial [Deltaproteobacteria bacterium]
MSAPGTQRDSLLRRVLRSLFRIRTKLLIAQMFLVLVPLTGSWFARTYERELLRAEEDGLHAVTVTLAVEQGDPADPALLRRVHAAAAAARAQIRVIMPDGRAAMDSGPEQVEMLTRGRELVSSIDPVSSRQGYSIPTARLGDPGPASGRFETRAEVARALAGSSARATRRSAQGRGVRLFVAEPMRGPEGNVRAVVYASRSTYPVLVSMYHVRNGLRWIAAGSVALAAVVGLFLAFTISRPLRRL